MIKECLDVSGRLNNGRSLQDIAIKLMEETGEIAAEVSKDNMSSYKGDMNRWELLYEIADAYNCLIDMAHWLDFTEEEIKQAIAEKLEKWEDRYNRIHRAHG